MKRPSVKRGSVVLVAVALLLACGACGGPMSGPQDAGLVKQGDDAGASDLPPVPRTIRIFFLQYGKPAAVTRRIAGGTVRATMQQALTLLLKGPTGAERRNGYFSPIDKATQLLDVETDEFNDATANFTPQFNVGTSNKGDEVPLKVAMVAKTLGGLGIRATSVQVTGSNVPVADAAGNQTTRVDAESVDHYLLPEQYSTFTCNATSETTTGGTPLELATPKSMSLIQDRTVQFSGGVSGDATVLKIQLILQQKGVRISLGSLSRTCDGSFSGSLLAPLGVSGDIVFQAVASDPDGTHVTRRRRTIDLASDSAR